MSVTVSNNATQIINTGLLGPGITAINVTGQVGTISAGIFNAPSVSNFPFSNGMVLSTGQLSSVMPSTPSFHSSTSVGLPGDATLDNLVIGSSTQDAIVLEFDFACAGDSVKFDFIFASEEYNDYVNTPFNDVFGFFVTGPGYSPNTNVALLPGTTTPITINNVNNGGPTAGVGQGPCMNCAYFFDNLDTLNNTINLSPDAFTVPIEIKFPVQACGQYHFKIAIADVSDGIFDSWVFIKQQSYTACPLQLMANNVFTNHNDTLRMCHGNTMILTCPDAATYNWSTGATTKSINVTQPGLYQMFAVNPQFSGCFAWANDLVVVWADSIPVPDIIFNNDTLYTTTTAPNYNYMWSLNNNLIPGATQPFIPATQQGCYTVSITNPDGCDETSVPYCLTGLNESSLSQVLIKPHPVTGVSAITIPFEQSSNALIQVFDIFGKKVRELNTNGDREIYFNSNGMAAGMYILHIKDINTSRVVNRRMLVNPAE